MVIPLHVWLYIKRMVIHIYLYSNIPLYHMRLYMWLCVMVRVNGASNIENCKNYKKVITHQHIA